VFVCCVPMYLCVFVFVCLWISKYFPLDVPCCVCLWFSHVCLCAIVCEYLCIFDIAGVCVFVIFVSASMYVFWVRGPVCFPCWLMFVLIEGHGCWMCSCGWGGVTDVCVCECVFVFCLIVCFVCVRVVFSCWLVLCGQ